MKSWDDLGNIPLIYVVDDDATMRLLMTETLAEGNYDIREFENGLEAMEAIRLREPDMILLDVKMPGMSGFEVCSEIQTHYDDTNISIVMVTGLDDFESIEKAFQLGATAFINKPINWITFPYQIQYLLKARTAFVDIKEREVHLEHMERISRSLTQSKDLDVILHEVLQEMLAIFSADRVVIFKIHNQDVYDFSSVCEALSENTLSINGHEHALLKEIESGQLRQARNSEFPVMTAYDEETFGVLHVRQQLLRSLYKDDDFTWFLVTHQCKNSLIWSTTDHETFYRICIRLGAVLSRYLLTEKLHQNERLLRQAQQIGRLGNWRWNVITGQLAWSDEVYRIHGYPPGSIVPTRDLYSQVIFEDDLERVRLFKGNAFQLEDTWSIEYRIVLPDGEIRWVHEQGVGTVNHEGVLIEVNGTLQDVTDRHKKQEREVHENKMEAIGQLTSGVAHDFGNLMTIAKGNLELLDELLKGSITSEAMEILEDARSAIQDGVELTKQLLAISRKKSLVVDHINISTSITGFSKILKNTLGDNIELVIDIEQELPDIRVDSAQFESTILNVVINARDAMPAGGKLVIRAQTESTAHADGTDRVDVILSFTDTGTGMTSSVLQHAIEPFFTTKSNGTGLGLSMVYGFMRQSGGDLNIESTVGKGTRLIMKFPAHIGKTPETVPAAAQKLSTVNAATVLVVEDRPAVRQFAVRCLEQLGLSTLTAENAETARQLLSSGASIDLLFTDILMPGSMNGRELATWTSAHYPEVKVLLTTASERQAMQLHTGDQPHFQLLQKPYGKPELIAKVLELL